MRSEPFWTEHFTWTGNRTVTELKHGSLVPTWIRLISLEFTEDILTVCSQTCAVWNEKKCVQVSESELIRTGSGFAEAIFGGLWSRRAMWTLRVWRWQEFSLFLESHLQMKWITVLCFSLGFAPHGLPPSYTSSRTWSLYESFLLTWPPLTAVLVSRMQTATT